MTSSERHQALIDKAGVNDIKSLELRLIRYHLTDPKGAETTYIMVTNLMDQETYPTVEFKAIYKARRRIEGAFKTYKISVEIEHWSGLSWLTAQQDFNSSILLVNMTRVFSFQVDEDIKEQSHKKLKNGEIKKLKSSILQKQFAVFGHSLEV
ncbi:hypothetical protein PQO03_01370 [Lentisphaera profundi]|uniref:Transposase IS4-like domain-containing protein n=1 Tax=Lentisphaera profundi TaxID=1658616 RepID=A0ABY7VRF8_9BACT|nr:hypothetical protein [Lentisphaera profundi]WDE96617.1 hypothetical protein PQO03_01370 [Lentisphaera profundi]